jgi:outer membrane protein assembly factor BamB
LTGLNLAFVTKRERAMNRVLQAMLAVVIGVGVAQGGDWPQWRGAGRDGCAATCPSLATSWPKDGPRKLWQSESMPAENDNGYGSVSVAGGKAFLYISWEYIEPIATRKLSDNALRDQGWDSNFKKVPAELAAAVETARVSDERAKLKDDKARDEWVGKWIADNVKEDPTNDPKKEWPGLVKGRLNRGKNALALDVVNKLATIKDKEFATQDELDKWYADNGIDEAVRKVLAKAIPVTRPYVKDTIVCVDATTGATVWKKDYPGGVAQWGASNTPCIADGRCYVLGSVGDAYCLAVADGKEIWKAKVGKGVESSSFTVCDGSALALLEGGLTVLDIDTGKVQWAQPKVRGGSSSPVIWVKDGQKYVICNAGSSVSCVEFKTGKVLWAVPGGGQSTAAISGDYMVILADKDDKTDGLFGYKIAPDKAEKIWSVRARDRGTSPIIYNGNVYALGAGQLVCVELESGTVKWTQKTGGSDIVSPILADGKLLVPTDGGSAFTLVDANPARYIELAKVKDKLRMVNITIREHFKVGYGIGCYDLVDVAPVKPAEK